MESDEANRKPIAMQTYAGVTVTFNPHWVLEIKTGERTVAISRHSKFLRYHQRIIIIHTLNNAYQIPARWWVERCDPASLSILFSMAVIWRRDIESAEHVMTCPKRHKYIAFEEKESRKIEFSYLDVEQVAHRDGTVLWKKQR